MRNSYLYLLILLLTVSLSAKNTTEKTGDIFALLIPLSTYGTTLYLDDKDGQYQFYKSYGTTLASTYILKYTIKEERPDKSNDHSFPSAHTSSSFSCATFIHKRYGFRYAVVPYLVASFVGYSRVDADKHYTHDVISGAVIGIISSWFFTDRYKNLEVKPIISSDYKGLQLSYRW